MGVLAPFHRSVGCRNMDRNSNDERQSHVYQEDHSTLTFRGPCRGTGGTGHCQPAGTCRAGRCLHVRRFKYRLSRWGRYEREIFRTSGCGVRTERRLVRGRLLEPSHPQDHSRRCREHVRRVWLGVGGRRNGNGCIVSVPAWHRDRLAGQRLRGRSVRCADSQDLTHRCCRDHCGFGSHRLCRRPGRPRTLRLAERRRGRRCVQRVRDRRAQPSHSQDRQVGERHDIRWHGCDRVRGRSWRDRTVQQSAGHRDRQHGDALHHRPRQQRDSQDLLRCGRVDAGLGRQRSSTSPLASPSIPPEMPTCSTRTTIAFA
jgi:hypothetical protein